MKKFILLLIVPFLSFGQKIVNCIKGDCENGQGTYVFELPPEIDPDGNYKYKYVGEFKDGKKHGQGTMTSQEAEYVGEWKDGRGTDKELILLLFGTYVGEWKDGKEHGQGTQTNSRGGYVGEWKDGKEHLARNSD